MSLSESEQVGRFHSAEPCLHEDGVRPWDLICTAMSRNFAVQVVYLRTPSLVIYRERYAGRVRLRGLGPPDTLAVSVPVNASLQSRYWKRALDGAGFPCVVSSAVDVELGAGQEHFIALIGLPLLQRYLPPETASALARFDDSHLLPSSVICHRSLQDWLCRALREAHARPEMLSSPVVVQSLEEDMVLRLLAAIHPEMPGRPSFRCSHRSRGIDRALSYLSSVALRAVTVPEVCVEAGLTQRALERAFRETFDMTVKQYLYIKRLHAARRRLMAARTSETQVAAIAYDLGFYELGRFAVAYRAAFGERPSETFRRDPPLPRSRLML